MNTYFSNDDIYLINVYIKMLYAIEKKEEKTEEDLLYKEFFMQRLKDFYDRSIIIGNNMASMEITNAKKDETNSLVLTSKIILDLYNAPISDIERLDRLQEITSTLLAQSQNEEPDNELLNNEEELKLVLKK